MELQQIMKQKNIYKLIRPNETRWASLITCIERLLTLKGFVNIIIKDLEEDFWKNTEELYTYLKPFKSYIDKIQKDSASLYCVSQSLNNLKAHFNSEKLPKSYQDIKNITLNLIEDKWNKHINHDIMNVICFLNFEEKFKATNPITDFLKNWGSLYLITYRLTDENNQETLKQLLNLQIVEFNGRQTEFASLNPTIENIKSSCKIKDKIYNPILVWCSFLSSHFELSKVAIAILSICPSEASVERSFSMQSDVHSLERNKLSPDLVEAEMKVRNLK